MFGNKVVSFRLVLSFSGTFLLWFGPGAPALAQRNPLPPDLQDKVEQAIGGGALFLEQSQLPTGTWPSENNSHPVGYAALPGLTLIECGEPLSNPVIQRAAAFVRGSTDKLDGTYELSLAVLFLDRLRDPKDKAMIQKLAMRLVAGQSATGGWSYKCPVLTIQAQQLLLTTLQKHPLKKVQESGKKFALENVPQALRHLPLWHDPNDLVMKDPPDKGQEPRGTTDNSNTQFALLALWAARRSDVPVDRSLNLITHRFKTGQSPSGGWSYAYKYGGGDMAPAPTCAGMIGLALGQGLAQDVEARELLTIPGGAAKAAAAIGDPMLHNIALAARDVNLVLAVVNAAQQREKDTRIVTGFQALANHVGQPTGKTKDIAQVSFYFLWSLERVAVLYNMSTIGNKDWYRWGAEMLIANQRPQGFWYVKDSYPGGAAVIDTCLALLFLKRANLAADLSSKVRFGKTEVAKAPDPKPEPPPSPAPPAPPTTTPPVAANPPEPTPPPPVQPTAPSTPVVQTPSATVAPATSTEETAPKSKLWLIVLIIAGVLVVVGGLAIVLIARSGGGSAEEEERPRTKKRSQASAKAVPKARRRAPN